MNTIKANIPKIAIESFRKLADKCKKNVPGFDYTVGKERNEKYLHLCSFEGRNVLKGYMHPIFPVEITMPDDNGWQLLATYKDGFEFVSDPSEKLIPSNPEHGENYDHCDVCGHVCKNSYLIRNTTTGEELQVGCECAKKFGLNYIGMISKFTASLYTEYIIKYISIGDDEEPIWCGEPDRFAFSAIPKANLICAAKWYYDRQPAWIKGYRRPDGCYIKSESNVAIQNFVGGVTISEIGEAYSKTICEYALSFEADSEFTQEMHRLAKDYYATPTDAPYAFFMVKQYEDMLKAKEIGMDKFKEGVQLHVTGEIIDISYQQSLYEELTTYTIKTNSGVIVKRTGKVPFVRNDNYGTVDFYALVKFVKGLEITIDRAYKNAKKGIETIAV